MNFTYPRVQRPGSDALPAAVKSEYDNIEVPSFCTLSPKRVISEFIYTVSQNFILNKLFMESGEEAAGQ